MHRIARLCRERTSLQRLAGKLSAAEYERKSELDGLIGNAPRTQRSVRPECRQATRTGAQIARGCAWLGGLLTKGVPGVTHAAAGDVDTREAVRWAVAGC